MLPRLLPAAVATILAIAGAAGSTVLAQHAPSPTTPPTTPPLVIVTPTTTTTTTTTPLVIATPTTTTTTTTTTAPALATPTTTATTTTAPALATPTTTTTPVVVTPTTTTPTLVTPTVPPDEEDPADVPLGEIDPSGAVPEGLDLTAFPGAPVAAPGPVPGDGPTLAAGFTCAYQCIKSGVAYPRGFGAQLVVTTHVPARLFLSVVDNNNDPIDATNSIGMVTDFSWALDHLEPGQTYYAMVAATDENDDTAYAWGEFVTLSTRTVEISVSVPTVSYGPTNVVDTDVWLKTVDLDFWPVSPPETLVYYSLPRHVDLALLVFREWETSQYTLCEGLPSPDILPPQGDSDAACGSWNTATLDDLDLDAIPADRSRWTEVTIPTSLQSWSSGAIPGQPSDPRFFHVHAGVDVDVFYS